MKIIELKSMEASFEDFWEHKPPSPLLSSLSPETKSIMRHLFFAGFGCAMFQFLTLDRVSDEVGEAWMNGVLKEISTIANETIQRRKESE